MFNELAVLNGRLMREKKDALQNKNFATRPFSLKSDP